MIFTDPLLLLAATVCLAGFLLAVRYYHDTLHPFSYFMPMAAFIYVFLPLDETCRELLAASFPGDYVKWVKWMNLLFLVALSIGCIVGSGKRRAEPLQNAGPAVTASVDLDRRKRLTQAGLILGGCALAAYLLNITLLGGFVETYSEVKGGAAGAASGYLRDPFFWAVPATLLLQLGAHKAPWRNWNYLAVALIITPFLLQGMLASRRGPTFMAFASVGAGWYLARGRRPSFPVLLGGGTAIGLLLLLLVAFRAQLHLGSDLYTRLSAEMLAQGLEEKMTKESYGNEFFYGANVMLSARERERHYWGKRLLTIAFIRPIPKQLWPTKYEDVGMSEYMINVGLGYGDALLAPAPPGAATGFAADLYAEFASFGLVAAALIGWYYGRCWRLARRGGHFAIINYGCLIAFAIFFIAQTSEAILSRYLVVIIPTMVLWWWLVRRPGKRKTKSEPGDSPRRYRRSRRRRTAPPPPQALPASP